MTKRYYDTSEIAPVKDGHAYLFQDRPDDNKQGWPVYERSFPSDDTGLSFAQKRIESQKKRGIVCFLTINELPEHFWY